MHCGIRKIPGHKRITCLEREVQTNYQNQGECRAKGQKKGNEDDNEGHNEGANQRPNEGLHER